LKRETNKSSPSRKRGRADDEVERLGAKYLAKQAKKSQAPSSGKEFAGTESPKPLTMERTKSLETISKAAPPMVWRLCLEKVKAQMQDSEHKDYKKIKYYLKIAVNVAKDSVSEVYEHVRALRTSYSWDAELREMLASSFPEAFIDS